MTPTAIESAECDGDRKTDYPADVRAGVQRPAFDRRHVPRRETAINYVWGDGVWVDGREDAVKQVY